MKRKFLEELKDWQTRNIKEPLMIVGARQIGKTYIINEFCEENYENYLYLNFNLLFLHKVLLSYLLLHFAHSFQSILQ